MRTIQLIRGGRIVTPHQVIEGGTIVIADGRIAEISKQRLDIPGAVIHEADGLWVLPGMIDSHSDAIEHEMQPRPSSRFPLEFSFYELERKLAAQGITTIYHSLSMWDDNSPNEARRNSSVSGYVDKIRALRSERYLIRHKIHIRYEITNLTALPYIEAFIRKDEIDQLSFMDHTPGQGQYRDIEVQLKFHMMKQKKSREEALAQLELRKRQEKASPEALRFLAGLAEERGLPLASHDDDSVEKLALMSEWHAVISEFPVTLEVAQEAKRKGMYVVMGAPNVMLGRSHSNNVSARDAIREGVVDILCSDYYPPSMLQSVFLLSEQGFEMPAVVNLVSKNPASALGLDNELGSIEPGKTADLLLVSEQGLMPSIEKVFVEGQIVCQMSYKSAKLPNVTVAAK